MRRYPVALALLSAAAAVMLSTGIRQSFGLFQLPIVATLEVGRESYSLAIAIGNLLYGLPLVGFLADRFGPRLVIIGGALLYIAGLLTLTQAQAAGGLVLSLGVLVGLALSATTYVVVLGAVAQLVPAGRRSRTFGAITAAGSSGMFLVPPLTQFMLDQIGWQSTARVLAGVAGLILALAFGLPNRRKQAATVQVDPDRTETFRAVLSRARTHRGYLLLIAGFFVCGFHVAFIGTHLPAHLVDNGLTALDGATALSLVGAFNLVGSYLFGWLGDHYRKPRLLTFLYFMRAVVIVLFLVLPLTRLTALGFASAIGFLWLATVPLTSGTVAQIFGTRYLSSLYGIVFLSHQIGAFLGVWLGGRLYDVTGSYTIVWLIAVGLAIFASLIHTPISERPLQATRYVT